MRLTEYPMERGETLILGLDAMQGDVGIVTAVTTKMRRLAPGTQVIAADTPLAAQFEMAERAAAGEIPAGWTFTLGAADSAALAAGRYLVDARLTHASGVVTTESVVIVLREPASLTDEAGVP